MGIDIYARWKNQTKSEANAQITGWSTTHGHAGYLREAYHGGPYVTKFLLREAFEKGRRNAPIPAKTLRERLPAAVLLALYREQKVYGNAQEPHLFDIAKADGPKQLAQALSQVFTVEISDMSHVEIAAHFGEDKVAVARQLIESKRLPDYAQSFVDFVDLCDRMERQTGEPCRIVASY